MPFETEHIELMRAAYHKACDALGLGGVANETTEIIVLKILEFVTSGETDPDRISCRVLATMSEHREAS